MPKAMVNVFGNKTVSFTLRLLYMTSFLLNNYVFYSFTSLAKMLDFFHFSEELSTPWVRH